MAGMGVLHLRNCNFLVQELGLDIKTTQPLINYRETVKGRTGHNNE